MEENRELSDPIALLIKVEDGKKGSGFFVKEDLIVTNIHVVAGVTSISAKVVDTNGNTIKNFNVEGVKSFDAKNDLVILKIAGEETPHPIGNSDLVQSGDIVRAIGYPNGVYKVTEGPIHGVRASDKWLRLGFKTIQGNSGGPVLNRNGEVIGVSVGSSDSCSFAIPANVLKVLLAQTQETEPLVQWQKKEPIRAYACLVRSRSKHSKSLYGEMIDDLDEAIQLYPDYFLFYDNRGVAHRLMDQSKVKSRDLAGAQQHYQNAIADHTESIKLCPDYAVAYDNRGTAKADLGQSKSETVSVAETQQHYRDAIADYTKAIKLCPDYALVYVNRGATQSDLGQSKIKKGNVTEAQQHYRDAIADYTKAIKLCPDYALAYNGQADVKFHFGKSEDAVGNIEAAKDLYQEALIDVNTAIKLDSEVALFYHTRGEIKHALGDYNAAIEDYEKASGIDPDYTDVCQDLELAKKALEQLEEGMAKD